MRFRVLVVPAVLGLLLAPAATAGKPTIERFDVDASFPDAFLTGECGVPVTTHLAGHVIVRTFDRDHGLLELNTLNLALTATAGENAYRFRDVGADQLRLTKDGPVLSIIGQIPFGFTGILRINLETGQVVHEPAHDISGRVDEACAALTA